MKTGLTFRINRKLKDAIFLLVMIILLPACSTSDKLPNNSLNTSTQILTSTIKPKNTDIISTETLTLAPTATERAYVWDNIKFNQGNISTLVIDPHSNSIMYMAIPGDSSAGVYKSEDGGSVWEKVLNGYMFTVVIDPEDSSILYTGGFGGGIYKSNDSGEKWTSVNNGITESGKTIFNLYIQPTNPEVIYAATSGGIYTSKDQGNKWENIGLTKDYVSNLAFDGNKPDTIYAGTKGDGIYRTIDGGINWTRIWYKDEKTDITALTIDPLSSANVFMGFQQTGTLSFGLYKSIDDGVNWKDIDPIPGASLTIYTLTWDLLQPNSLYCGTSDGVYKTSDNGDHWVFFGPEHFKNIYSIIFTSVQPIIFYLGSDGIIYFNK